MLAIPNDPSSSSGAWRFPAGDPPFVWQVSLLMSSTCPLSCRVPVVMGPSRLVEICRSGSGLTEQPPVVVVVVLSPLRRLQPGVKWRCPSSTSASQLASVESVFSFRSPLISHGNALAYHKDVFVKGTAEGSSSSPEMRGDTAPPPLCEMPPSLRIGNFTSAL